MSVARFYSLDRVEEAVFLVTIRLARIGKKKQPYYRIVVIDKSRARNGRFLEVIGHYNPLANPADVDVNEERSRFWLSRGAQPSETVQSIFRKKEIG